MHNLKLTEQEIQYLLDTVEMDIGSGKLDIEELQHAKSVFNRLSKLTKVK